MFGLFSLKNFQNFSSVWLQVWQYCLLAYFCGVHPNAQGSKYVLETHIQFILFIINLAVLVIVENYLMTLNFVLAVPVATFVMAVLCGTDKLRCDVFLNMVLVSVGVVISSYGEIHFNVVGTVYQVTGIFAEALRLVLTQVLLQKKGLTLNPVTSLYYIAPCRYMYFHVPSHFH